MTIYFARGSVSSGGSRSSYSSSRSSTSSSRSSSTSRSSTSKSTASKSTSSKPVAAKPSGKSTAKPGSTVKTSSGKTVKTSTAKPTNIKNARSTGVVGDNGYTPRFSGYNAPAGSVVYYPQHSFTDYLPWIYLFSMNSPHNDTATIVQPDNKQVTAQPQRGVDGMYIFNWFMFIVIVIAIFAGIIYFIDKHFKNKELTPHEAY